MSGNFDPSRMRLNIDEGSAVIITTQGHPKYNRVVKVVKLALGGEILVSTDLQSDDFLPDETFWLKTSDVKLFEPPL